LPTEFPEGKKKLFYCI